MAEPALQLASLTKRFGALTAVDAIDLAVAQGEFVTLLGPSGCGKTTTLSMIAGFIPPDAGSIRLQGRVGGIAAAVPSRSRPGVPGLRAVPAHDGGGECRLRPAHAPRAARGDRPPRRGGARSGAAARPRRAAAVAALGRTAAARRARARAGDPPRHAAAGRAAVQPRPQAARGDAGRDLRACSGGSASRRCSSRTTRARR